MPKISVIIPVYNTAKYLKRCLDSVCNQTLEDIEIICVDDFSSDSSVEILQEYSKNYKNLTALFLEKNQGVSNARNLGLELAKGEYVAFVDSDDEIDLNFYEKLYKKAKAENADLVKGRAIEISYNGNRIIVNEIMDGSKWFFLSFWLLAIFKRSLILENNISFSTNHSLGEDFLFLNRVLTKAKNLYLVNEVYYHYYRREESGDSKILSEEKIQSALSVFEIIIDNINLNISANSYIYSFLYHHYIMSCFYLSLKTTDKSPKRLCAKTAINIFDKCQNKESLKTSFSKTAPYLFMLLNAKDINGVEDLLVKCKSPIELVVEMLRARVKNKYLL